MTEQTEREAVVRWLRSSVVSGTFEAGNRWKAVIELLFTGKIKDVVIYNVAPILGNEISRGEHRKEHNNG